MTTTHETNGQHEDAETVARRLAKNAQPTPAHDEAAAKRKAIWAALDEAREYYAAAIEEIGIAETKVSDAIRAIIEATGKQGFVRNGEPLVFAKRKGKDVFYIKSTTKELEEVTD